MNRVMFAKLVDTTGFACPGFEKPVRLILQCDDHFLDAVDRALAKLGVGFGCVLGAAAHWWDQSRSEDSVFGKFEVFLVVLSGAMAASVLDLEVGF